MNYPKRPTYKKQYAFDLLNKSEATQELAIIEQDEREAKQENEIEAVETGINYSLSI